MLNYLQTFIGYCFTGEVKLNKLFFLYGSTANGKSTFLEFLKVLFPEVVTIGNRSLIESGTRARGGPAADKISIINHRLVYIEEIREGDNYDPEDIKALTGSNTIKARAPYGKEELEYLNISKIIGLTNNYPGIKLSMNERSITRRLSMIPFKCEFVDEPNPNKPYQKEIDRSIVEQLIPDDDEELNIIKSAVLNWIIDGAFDFYQSNKLPKCSPVDDITEHYHNCLLMTHKCSSLDLFLTEEAETVVNNRVLVTEFNKTYRDWCERKKEKAFKNTDIVNYMYRKFGGENIDGQQYYTNIRLKESAFVNNSILPDGGILF